VTTADARGVFLFQDLQAGSYKLTFSALSFANTVESGVQVIENTARRIDVQLQLASVGQTVTVAADTAVLQTDRADVNTQVSRQEITDLPTAGTNGSRNFESVFVTIPGFGPPAAATSTPGSLTSRLTFLLPTPYRRSASFPIASMPSKAMPQDPRSTPSSNPVRTSSTERPGSTTPIAL
jgi:hypothetical protein